MTTSDYLEEASGEALFSCTKEIWKLFESVLMLESFDNL